MNVVLWILAEGVVGWAGFAYLGFNEARGKAVSMVIGVAGGFLGGNMLAPMFGAAAEGAGEFSMAALAVALASAAACTAVASTVHSRFGV